MRDETPDGTTHYSLLTTRQVDEDALLINLLIILSIIYFQGERNSFRQPHSDKQDV